MNSQPTARTRAQLAEFTVNNNSNGINNINTAIEAGADIQRTISSNSIMTDSANAAIDDNAGSIDNDNDDSESRKQQRVHIRNSDVSNKRKSQVRQRQQNHTLELERKANELEKKVAELSATIQQYHTQSINNNISNGICLNVECSTKLATMVARNQALERQILQMYHSHTELRFLHYQQPAGRHPMQHSFKNQTDPNQFFPFDITVPSFQPHTHITSAATSGGCDDSRDRAASSVGRSNRIADLIENEEIAASADLFGRLDIETFRVQLNTLLRGVGTREINELIDSALSMIIKRNLLDRCDEIDRPHAIAIIEGMKEAGNNMMHWNHWYQSIAATVNLDTIPEINSPLFSDEMREILQKTVPLQETVRDNILSLSGHAHLVRALCVEYAASCLCKDEDEQNDRFGNALAIQGLLQGL
ncbi:hypothetical protein HK100_011723, partial [Physocladia obscura]